MKTKSLPNTSRVAVALWISLVLPLLASAQVTWSGASGTDLNWSTAANWSPAGPPGPGDAAHFFDDGAALDAVTPDNIVSASTTVQSLWYGQTNNYHNTVINSGMSLTLSGTGSGHVLLVGTETQPSVTEVVNASISGPGGALAVDNTNADVFVRQTDGSAGAHSANLDLSGLDILSASVSRVQVGVGDTTLRRATGNLILARTNTITLSGSSPQLLVSDNSGNNNNNGTLSAVTLGIQNSIFANTIRIGGQKCNGAMNFGSTVSSLYLRGSDGTNPVSEMDIGDNSSQSGSGNPSQGAVDLSNGTADILAGTIYIGRGQHGSGKGGATGTLKLGAGTVDVNTLEVAYQNNSGAVGAVSGTVNVGSNGLFSAGATLIVNSNLDLGRSAGSSAPINATLNVSGGTVQVGGTVSSAGNVSVNITNGLLNLAPGSALNASVLTVDGGVISNLDIIAATNSLLLANGGVLASPRKFDMGPGGSAMWDVSGATGGGLTVSNEFGGAGYFTGNLTMAPGSVLNPGDSDSINSLNLLDNGGGVGNLTLNGTKILVDLSSSGGDQVNASTLTLGATNDVELSILSAPLNSSYTLITYGGTLTGDSSYFRASGPLATSRYTFGFSAGAGSVVLSVGGAGAADLLWVGDGVNNTWDLTNSADWNNGGSADKFYTLDNVTFDDTGSASPAIQLVGDLLPGAITMSNTSKAYIFAGSGGLAGGSLTNYGAGGLTLSNNGTNRLYVMDVENGNVTFAGNTANQFGAGGLLVNPNNFTPGVSVTIANTNVNDFGPAGIVLNNATLTFDQPTDAELASPITDFGGSSTIIKTNTNTLTLSGDDANLASPVLAKEGTLRLGNSSALGSGGVIVSNSATLDLNGQALASIVPVTASGAGVNGSGAIVNSGPQDIYALVNVTLAGDTTFGGEGRWDIRGSGAVLNTYGNPFNITKVGTNQVALVGTFVDPALGNVDIQQGQFSLQTSTVSTSGGFGDSTKTITVHPGAIFETWGLGAGISLNKVIVLQDDATIQNDSSESDISGPVTLQGGAVFNANALFIFSSVIDGSGSLTNSGSSTLVLQAANTYTGATVVSNGTLQVDGSIGGTGVDVQGGTLAGIGSISAPTTIDPGGTLSPGDGTNGILSIASTLTLSGTCLMNVDDTAGVFTSDLVTNVTALTLGGALQLNLTGDTPLAAGDAITLFSAGSITGAFSSITPAPGPGLQWELSGGVLKVAVATAAPTIGSVSYSDGNLVFSGSGGTAGGSYTVLTSTNLDLPLSSWTPVATNQFDVNGDFSWTNNVASRPQGYFTIEVQ